jgi:hypothetical protein
MVYFVISDLRRVVIVRFVGIDGNVDHCLNFNFEMGSTK